MLAWLWECAHGRSCDWPALITYGVMVSPAVLNTLIYVLRPAPSRLRTWMQSIVAFLAFLSATLLIYPIPDSAVTDYLTLGVVLFVLNSGSVVIQLMLIGSQREELGPCGLTLGRITIAAVGIAVGILVRTLG